MATKNLLLKPHPRPRWRGSPLAAIPLLLGEGVMFPPLEGRAREGSVVAPFRVNLQGEPWLVQGEKTSESSSDATKDCHWTTDCFAYARNDCSKSKMLHVKHPFEHAFR